MNTYTVAAKFTSATPVRGGGYAHWTVVNGHALYYEVWRTGVPLVLLQGGGDTVAGSLPRQLGIFALSHKVIEPEQVGQGHTPDGPEPLIYSAMIENTVRRPVVFPARHAARHIRAAIAMGESGRAVVSLSIVTAGWQI